MALYECRILNSVGKLLRIVSEKELIKISDNRIKSINNNPFHPNNHYWDGPDSYKMYPSKEFGDDLGR